MIFFPESVLRRSVSEYAKVNQHYVSKISLVKEYVNTEMNKISGKNISKVPIIIHLYLKDTIEVSLVDLPGFIKIPIDGQPVNIESQIEKLVYKYIREENSLILAITPANHDLANSESLKLSRQVDVSGVRTIGVVTKIDLMDKETDCLDIFINKRTKLELGFIGTMNRSQKDLNEGLDLERSACREKEFFENHKDYSKIYPRIGSEYLRSTLENVFLRIVNRELPLFCLKIDKKIVELCLELKSYEAKKMDNGEIIKRYSKIVKNIVKEKHLVVDDVFEYKSESKLVLEFKNNFKIVNEDSKIDKGLFDEIKGSNSIFISEEVFNGLIYQKTETLKRKIMSLFDNILVLTTEHMKKIKSNIYGSLLNTLTDEMNNILVDRLEMLKNDFDRFMKIQTSFINLNHPDFCKANIMKNILRNRTLDQKIDESRFLSNLFGKGTKKLDDSFLLNEHFKLDLLLNFSKAYFEIIKKSVVDYGIKSAYFHFFVFLKNEVGNLLVERMGKYDMRIFEENDEFTNRETEIRSEIERCKKIVSIMKE